MNKIFKFGEEVKRYNIPVINEKKIKTAEGGNMWKKRDIIWTAAAIIVTITYEVFSGRRRQVD